jgi:hypothetical protein
MENQPNTELKLNSSVRTAIPVALVPPSIAQDQVRPTNPNRMPKGNRESMQWNIAPIHTHYSKRPHAKPLSKKISPRATSVKLSSPTTEILQTESPESSKRPNKFDSLKSNGSQRSSNSSSSQTPKKIPEVTLIGTVLPSKKNYSLSRDIERRQPVGFTNIVPHLSDSSFVHPKYLTILRGISFVASASTTIYLATTQKIYFLATLVNYNWLLMSIYFLVIKLLTSVCFTIPFNLISLKRKNYCCLQKH